MKKKLVQPQISDSCINTSIQDKHHISFCNNCTQSVLSILSHRILKRRVLKCHPSVTQKKSKGNKKEASNKAESKHGTILFHKVKFSLPLISLLYTIPLVPTLSKCVSETQLYSGKFKFLNVIRIAQLSIMLME